MSHFSSSHSPANSDPKSIYNESTSTPHTPPNGISGLGDRQPSYPGKNPSAAKSDFFHRRGHARAVSSTVPASPLWVDHDSSPLNSSPITVADHNRSRSRSSSRPLSMVQAYQPPRMDINEDTIPELQPIFTFLNSHANKLYQEGYFLKLDDQNTQGKPNPDRTWTECFAQLVGTVLSLWDAAELDAAGEDGEVLPKFINLTDASIKMIESLPTRSNEEQPLQNILSISTAGRNRYLLHFNSRQSLIQWTSGIRLAMFEHSTLQEAYTGALIAGKGKHLNNIGVIMERSRVDMGQWVRVRFGAGVPWRRCWCAISPPDEKEYQKAMKEHKKKNPYDRSHPPILKGDIKFYDQRKEGKKQKKVQPIATINDAYSAYALYPQSKSLIDASTLIKIEGDITIHADPPSSTEGFVFIMPEVNPAVSGFEMMLRFLFPTWDTFGLYGRPGRLVASVLDSRSLMFAMPKHKRYGYLELLDVSSLILTDGNATRSEREWRKKLKELTGTRMNTTTDESESSGTSRTNSRTKRLSSGPAPAGNAKPRVGFADDSSPPPVRSSRSMSLNSGQDAVSGMPTSSNVHPPGEIPPPVPRHNENPYTVVPGPVAGPDPARSFIPDFAAAPGTASSEEERMDTPIQDFDGMRRMQTPEPVSQPPRFSHAPGDKPNNRPYHSPEMRRANSRLSINTLNQLTTAGNVSASPDVWSPESERNNEAQHATSRQDSDQPGLPPVHLHVNNTRIPANFGSHEVIMNNPPRSPGFPSDMDSSSQRSRSPFNNHTQPDSRGPTPTPRPKTPTSRPGTASGNRPPGPPNFGHQGNHPAYRGPPPPGPPPGPPGMPPPGRGRGYPPPNMAGPGRGYPNGPQNMYTGSAGPGGRGGPRSPPPNRGEQLPPLDTSPIHRKPLPVRSDSLQQRSNTGGVTPATESASSASFTGHRIDTEGFGQIRAQNVSGPGPQPSAMRYDTMISQASSRYDDGASTSSPDYASSRPSTGTSASVVERPRAGVLKTVGAPEEHSSRSGGSSFEIPGIDFGPTLNYAAAPRNLPSSGGIGIAQTSNPSGPRAQSPNAAFPQRPVIPGASHSRQGSEENVRKSVVWQPAGTSPGSGGPSLSAEEFVQQRAATATPLYAHQRHSSGNTLASYRAGTPTPPLGRGQDKDYIGTAHSRNSSHDLLQRPSSRGAGEFLQRRKSGELLQRPGSRGAGAVLGGQQSQGESHLSAREQEHVARITGSPLINMAGNKNAPQTGGGLIGAIEDRERGREQMKQGWASQAAQNAIQRQQQQQPPQPGYAHYQRSMSPSPMLPPPAGMYSNMGRGMVPPSPRQHGFGMGRGYGGPEQEGNWAPGSGGFRSPPPGNMDPRFMSPQGQYSSSPPYSPGPRGGAGGARGQNPYHGQAF
ncbi:hypothetical protein F5B22DRAFT_642180 [Xylaria bambusicola]|uniref:uncharacterized protein n=1 Tax=Xylaria bambusicola TaxID=326684 RepID=UPI0020077F09|nr:uncharacterized protein F5B22DRAFT_642180 [Xylaria bambusicola]KAI0526023.1 hypothetical protein F5B22DRAFT_642180 [Xylaria bambusicola]